MALFHLNVSSIGKASGSSACASAAYRSCSQIIQTIIDFQTGLEVVLLHNFSSKQGLAFSKIFAPEGSADWCSNREQLWNKVEARETHIKGRYARDIKLALQTEFSLEQNIQILSEYVKDTFVRDGIIADVNIHMDDSNNPHAHIMLTTRNLEINDNDEWVFGNKNRLLDSKGWLIHIRNNWAEINNKYFIIHDIDKSITHESYETRGLGFIKATIHEGAAKHAETVDPTLERTSYNRNTVFENLEYIKTNPDEVIQALAQNASKSNGAFSRADLFKAIENLLNEIASRDFEESTLIDEARASIFAKCGEIFREINQLDLNAHANNIMNNTKSQNIGEHYADTTSQTQINQQVHLQNVSSLLQENVIGITERFFENTGKKVNIEDEFEYIKANSTKLIEEISHNKAVFSKVDLAKVLDKHINEAILQEIGTNSANHELLNAAKIEILEKYNTLLLNLMSSSEIVKLVNSDLGGKEVYTTKAQLNLEKEFIANLEKLSSSAQHSLHLEELAIEAPSFRAKFINRLNSSLAKTLTPEAISWLEKTFKISLNSTDAINLSDEQRQAVLSLINGNDIICLSGMPGTGKSTVMAKLVQEYINHGYEVVGAATSAVAALNLGTAAGIKSYTLSKWQHDWDLRAELEAKGEDVKKLLPNLTSKSIFIVDEMSMVDLRMFNYITAKIIAAEAKIINLGDNNQFSAIGIGGASEKITERAENVVLTELFRQRSDLDKEITRKLANYRVDEALILLDQAGRIKTGSSPELTRGELVNNYISNIHSNHDSIESRVILAYSNKEVQAINVEIRTRLLNSGLLLTKNHEAGGREFVGSRGKLKIALNEQLVFTKNHHYLGVLNGQVGRVVEIINDTKFKVQLLDKASGKQKLVIVNNEKIKSFDYGYAITASRSQGLSYDHCDSLIDSLGGYEALNVMATRHRISSTLYIDKGLLNQIINRKFDNLKDVYHQHNERVGNEQAALFELLTRRNPRALAHDYINYEKKAEVMQIRAYLECRDKASSVYRQLLDWQLEVLHQGQKLQLWDNEQLWAEFNSLREIRQQYAQELVEGYPQYQKYINSTVINYATLLKHAEEAKIEFNYSDNTKALDQRNPSKEANIDYHELIVLCQSYLNNSREGATIESILTKADELVTIQQEHKCNLARLSSQINTQENNKWILESQKKASIHYREDLEHYLNQTYKNGAKAALDNWNKLKRSMGIRQAIVHLKNNPESLGDLVGLGWSTKLVVSEARALAVFNLQSLARRIEGYERALTQEQQLSEEITTIETKELTPLKFRYNQLNTINCLSTQQEKYIHELLDHRDNLVTWLQEDKTKDILNNLSTQKSELKLGAKTKLSLEKDKPMSEADNKIEHGQREQFASTNINTKAAVSVSPYNNIQAKISYAQMHDKLSDNIFELAQQLLPSLVDKKIEISKRLIQCGSISISLEGSKRGLWCRFSRDDEKGDLFDLIRVSQKLANKQAAIEWGKVYLGLSSNNHVASQALIQENSNNANISSGVTARTKLAKVKILSPVPHDATVFNPERLFATRLANKVAKNQVIENVYAYKNIKNELCGYIVRIKDIESDAKITLPVVYTENNHGIKSWRAKGFGDDRCLYNEQRLYKSNKPVLIVEGEKTADTAQSLYPEFNVISWSGGANGFSKSNWNVLKDKQVTIWPDNDQAGIDAAHNIQTLLETKNIAKAKIIDLEKIDHLPAKWDLADDLPEKVKQHQITGALFEANGIANNVRIDKTVEAYLEYSQSSLNEEFNNKKLDTLSEYIKEREVIKCKLHYEAVLLKDKLTTKAILSNVDEVFISLDAKKLVNEKLKVISLISNIKLENISSYIQHDLAQLYQEIPKIMLIEVTNTALINAAQIIKEHNKLHQTNELNKHANNCLYKQSYSSGQYSLEEADLPIVALSLAFNILNHHCSNENMSSDNILVYEEKINELHSNHGHSTNQVHLDQLHLQSINMAKSSLKLQLEQDSVHFEQHQQRVMKRQMSQHQGLEI